jgi:hypothetical protein
MSKLSPESTRSRPIALALDSVVPAADASESEVTSSVTQATGVEHESGREAQPLRERVRDVATALRADLDRLVLALGGASPRLREMVAATNLDKTLLGRVLKVVRTPDAMEALEEIPSPQGLRMFVRAAASRGVAESSILCAEGSIDRFDALLREFEGRAGLDAALTGWVPGAWERRERGIRQAVHKSMSFLLGCQADAVVGAHILKPSADGDSCDVIMLRGRYGLRRLREGVPLVVFATRLFPAGESCAVETIDGTPEAGDPSSFLIESHCSNPMPSLRWLERGNDRLLVLERDEPALNEPVTLCLGVMARRLYQRYRTPEITEERHTGIPRMPCRVLHEDFLLHKDVYPGVKPVVETRLHSLSSSLLRETGELADLDRVDVSVETSWVGMDELATGEAPGYPDLVGETLDRAGWKASDFRVFRQRLVYPVPFVSVTTWFELPER